VIARLSGALGSRVPIDLTREQAQDAARSELAKPEYSVGRPGLVERAMRWVLDQISELFDRGSGVSPRGWFAVLIGIALLVLLVVVIRRRLGPVSAAGDRRLFVGQARTAAAHRAAADAAAAREAWADAVRERLRAIVRGLEERGLLDVRPGRTADEAARDAGMVLPSAAKGLRAAAAIFDDVWYGGRTATREHDERMRAVDAEVQAARPHALAPAGATGPGFAVPPR